MVGRREVHRRIVVNQPRPYAIQPPDSPEDVPVDRRVCEEVHGRERRHAGNRNPDLVPERFKAAVRRSEALQGRVRRIQTEGLCQLVPEDAGRCASVNTCRQTHAVFAGLQHDRNGDTFPLTAAGMTGSELDPVRSYQPTNGRSSSGTLAKKGRETPAACAAAFTAASFGPCATSRLPSSATHSPA